MATPIQLLQLSPTMSDGTIVKWLVKEGDNISAGDILAEIETDKAVMEQEAFEDGTILKLLVKEGSSVPVGGNIAVIGEEGEDPGDAGADAPTAEKKESKKDDKKAAKKDDKKTAKKEDEPDEDADEDAEEEESSKSDGAKKPAPKAKEKKPAAKAAPDRSASGGRVLVSPLARKMAEEHDLDLEAIHGSGPHGRIVKRDIESALESGGTSAPRRTAAAAASAEDEEISVSGMRKTIARRLVESRQEVPSFSLTVELDATTLLRAVDRLKAAYPDEKVTLTHFIIKAQAAMLMKHEWLRTQWIDGKMVRQGGAHISVAVAIEDGLLTPVIRDANLKGLVELSQELRELAGKARSRKLTEEDLSGGTQTLSNLGMFGIDNFDAIINPPESSILAVGAVIDKPVVRDGHVVPGKVMSLTLSCDHRVVDGAVGAAYLKDLKATLEEPLLVLA